ncbi:bifunctional DNA primase/polymerase [Nonomuraea sp. FMUSA5-5]|uniref:Bifunctional DNA primase/polymerase n=1 Tax=Nonomuraea composti TaxID=2720023 RepID=A0ABX1BLI3_9ACTN|nr:bifunctional DNA primase/polymerase [Nonomuraea sp. FMUSA5-5]NJP95973.1 bifunctional DNA primase/polymerase [Nonomuraea sp. FMUSA5-5]
MAPAHRRPKRRDDVTLLSPLQTADAVQPFPSESLSLARWCAAQGWPVHPLAPGRKFPARNCAVCQAPGHVAEGCPCLTEGRWCHGHLAATLDQQVINRWWRTQPNSGVGVACGPARLVVIDIDAHPTPVPERDQLLPGIPIHPKVDLTGLASGYHTLALLAALRGQRSPAEDATTLRVRTPSGGLHVWYRADPGMTFLCSTGSGKARALAWQVDVRAHGGYIIAPGTRTKDGLYTPLGESRQPAALPRWLAQELARTGHVPGDRPRTLAETSPPVPPRAREAVTKAGGGAHPALRILHTLAAEVEACAAVDEGAGFTAKLNRAAYTAGGLVAGGYLSRQDAEQELTRAARHARAGQENRSAKIIASGLTRGATRPLYLQGRS